MLVLAGFLPERRKNRMKVKAINAICILPDFLAIVDLLGTPIY
jgi:hypothetical protein